MATLGRLRLFHLFHLAKPASNRLIYREVWQQKPRRILEVGLGTAERATWMLQLAAESHHPRDLHYIGIDLFEDRRAEDGPGVSLREAHCTLKTTGARIQLVPGAPGEAFGRMANLLGQVDFAVLSPHPDLGQLDAVWFYLPRMLHDGSQVLLEIPGDHGSSEVRSLSLAEIQDLAGARRRRAA